MTEPSRLEVYVSRWKIALLLCLIGPMGVGGIAFLVTGHPAEGAILTVLGGPLTVLLVRQLILSGRPYLTVDSDGLIIETGGIRRGGKQVYAWAEIERLELLGVVTRPAAARGRTATSHYLEVYIRGREDPVEVAMSHLRGNSIELADRIERVAGVEIERREQFGAMPEADAVRRDV